MVTFEEFKKLELKIAQIKEVADHPHANRLYVLTIDLGDRQKQIVAGIKGTYEKSSLMGKQVVVVDNLEPALLRGVESQAMLLAAQDEQGICIISPERKMKLLSNVKVMENFLNADTRRCNADKRRFLDDNLRESAFDLRESALNKTFYYFCVS